MCPLITTLFLKDTLKFLTRIVCKTVSILAEKKCEVVQKSPYNVLAFRSFETKFHLKAYWKSEKKIYIHEFRHVTKMAAMSIYSKNLKNPVLQNQLTEDL